MRQTDNAADKHSKLNDDEPLQHIDWTNATEDFKTTGKATSSKVNIVAPAISGREVLMKAEVSDGGNDHFGIANGTSAANEFAPVFFAYKDSDVSPYPMAFRGMIDAANDGVGAGYQSYGLINFEVYRTTSPTDPNNGTWSRIQNRICFAFVNGPGASRTFPFLIKANDTVEINVGSGNLILKNLPTSSTGLPTGAIWNNSGVLNIK
jgi:hypothetical protein